MLLFWLRLFFLCSVSVPVLFLLFLFIRATALSVFLLRGFLCFFSVVSVFLLRCFWNFFLLLFASVSPLRFLNIVCILFCLWLLSLTLDLRLLNWRWFCNILWLRCRFWSSRCRLLNIFALIWLNLIRILCLLLALLNEVQVADPELVVLQF